MHARGVHRNVPTHCAAAGSSSCSGSSSPSQWGRCWPSSAPAASCGVASPPPPWCASSSRLLIVCFHKCTCLKLLVFFWQRRRWRLWPLPLSLSTIRRFCIPGIINTFHRHARAVLGVFVAVGEEKTALFFLFLQTAPSWSSQTCYNVTQCVTCSVVM